MVSIYGNNTVFATKSSAKENDGPAASAPAAVLCLSHENVPLNRAAPRTPMG